MNLIEQFDGYDEAWKCAAVLSEKLTEKQKSNAVFMDAFNALNNELLEHRRANNIFEVGGAIVRKWNNQVYYLIVDIDNDGQEFLISKDKNAKFKDCKVSDNICNFNHATPQEIEAGHRLWAKQ